VDHRHPVGLVESEYLKASVMAWWEKRLWNSREHVSQ
jgi:hypothetical protein